MNDDNTPRIQELFLAALELPAEGRDDWLVEQCGDDQQLLASVRELLDHDDIDDDPLEKGLDEALASFPSTAISPHDGAGTTDESFESMVGSDEFLSKLTQVGVLSPEEVHDLSRSFANGEDSLDPRQIASQLVSQGKLTDYQASALLHGQPELLIDKYLILDLLDSGGMGMVFKAIHRPMNRTVAIKMISRQLLSSPEQVKRFLREVRVAATLEHPNVVRSYDADQSNGAHFLVMEYVRGDNLTRIVRRKGPLSVEDAVDCIFQAAQGLRYAHKRGIIHRDIKPGNLMLTQDGLVKVLDLGLANIDESFRLAQQSSAAIGEDQGPELTRTDLTAPGTVLGTVSYMAPEQTLDANLADTRSDIYSLGCTLYFLLVGETPYKGETVFQVFLQHRDGPIPAVRSQRPDVPIEIELICQKMLAKEPDDRYQSMGELISAIEDCELDLPDLKRRRKKRRRQVPKIDIDTSQTSYVRAPKSDDKETGKTWLWGTVAFACLLLIVVGLNHFVSSDKQENNAGQFAEIEPDDRQHQSEGDQDNVPIPMQVSTTDPQYGLSFDGDDDYVELPSLKDFGTEPFTIEAFVACQGTEASYLVSASAAQLELKRNKGGFPWAKGILNNGFAVGHWAFSDGGKLRLIPAQRQHVAFTFDGDQPRIYIDGVFVSDKVDYYPNQPNPQGTSPEFVPIKPVSNHPDKPTLIGRCIVDRLNAPPRFFHGTIDEVRISTSARYTEDFTPVDRFEADADTLALYHFDEGEGDVLTDSSGNNHHGKIVGAEWVRVYDEANMSAADLLATGEYQWQVTERLPLTIHPTSGADMTADGLTLVVSSGESNRKGMDLWMATRDSIDSEWSKPVRLGDQINMDDVPEIHPSLTPDGLGLLFTRRLTGGETWICTRASTGDPWSEPQRFPLDSVYGPALTSDQRAVVVSNEGRIAISRRESSDAPWSQTATIGSPVDSGDQETFGSLSDDGRLLVFVRVQDDEPSGEGTLWMSTRPDWEAAWSKPVLVNLPKLKQAGHPRQLPDGKTIILTGIPHEGPPYTRGIYIARLTHKPPVPMETRSVSEGSDATNLSAADLLATGEYEWQVEKMPEPINSPRADIGDFAADLTADGLTIVFSSYREEGSYGLSDLWEASRDSIDAPWNEPVNLGHLVNSEKGEYDLTLSDDGLTVRFSRDGRAYMSVRESRTSPWTQAQAFQFPSAWITPTLTSDEITMCLGVNGRLAMTHRASVDAPWPNPKLLPETLSGNADIARGAISSDGRSLLIERITPNDSDQSQTRKSTHWLSSRKDADSDWSEPVQIDLGELDAQHVQFLPDGKTLSFSSRPLNGKASKIYIARLVRKPPTPIETPNASEGPDEANLSAADLLATGEYEWQVMEQLPEPINSPGDEESAVLTADECTIVFTKPVTGKRGDLWMATRASIDEPWSEPISLGEEVNTEHDERSPTIADDGRILMFSRRISDGGGVHTMVATRKSTSDPWSVPSKLFPEIGLQSFPHLTSDGLSLLVQRFVNRNRQDLFLSRRASLDADWMPATPVGPPVNSEAAEGAGSISDDGRLLVFSRAEGEKEVLLMATRDSWEAPWTEPVRVDSLNEGARNERPRLLPNGRTMLFASDRPGGLGNKDLYLARLVRKPRAQTQKVVDLLEAFDPENDVSSFEGYQGEWIKQKSGYQHRMTSDTWSKTANLRFRHEPVEDYRFETELALDGVSIFTVNLPLRGRWARFFVRTGKISTTHLRLSKGEHFQSRPAIMGHRNRSQRLSLEVVHLQENVSITAKLDGEPVLDYLGPLDSFSKELWPGSDLDPDQVALSLAGNFTLYTATLTPLTAADLLATGEYEWQVEQLTENIPVHSGADLSADELTLVFASFNQSIKKAEGFGKADLWMTTRDSKEAEWSKPVNLGDQINTEIEEVHPALSADGLSLLFTRLMPEGRRETWISTRTSITAPWPEPERFQFDCYVAPDLTGDRRSVVLSFGAGNLNIARRSASDAAWSNPVPVGPPINSDAHEDYGSISEEGRLLVFARGSGDGIEREERTQIWTATRPDWNAPWSDPIAISNSWEMPVAGQPRLLPDGKTILFTGSQDKEPPNRNVYLARLVPKNAPTTTVAE